MALADAVLAGAAPEVAIHQSGGRMFKKIVVAIDDSEDAGKALIKACEVARLSNAELHLVHVADLQYLAMGAASVAMLPDETIRYGQEILKQAEEKAEQFGGAVTASELLEGGIGASIVSHAEKIGADLIVIGSQGHSDLGGLLLGSVSHRVCNTAKCACLVVR
ncbi:universal stress protein [Marinobacterium arenosum]|uniref:universal stress protein n=1 Tax=Marinobacterium arenosum TaxID=2862496 RepID=UPI001C96DC19|nr:universal stress protein [Marinobacterium arenosum]MBY4677899.1 universal stress protein [Marinobacterium arenosum]